MIILPILLIKTSLPEKRNSLGSLTAWLRPFMNTLAVCMRGRSVEGEMQIAHFFSAFAFPNSEL
jgi:hypothetical protein